AIEENKESSGICYDNRKRELSYEVNIDTTVAKLKTISKWIVTANLEQQCAVIGEASLSSDAKGNKFISSIGRELLYAFDHTVHHLAIVRIGLQLNFSHIVLPQNLGVAPSTIKYREHQCVQ
ncbi:MAG: hypothetical protein JKY42_05430, partial [Flavobacteriales bacterium]|nr:hypothetical protein [Flavobacteriales bacterium]